MSSLNLPSGPTKYVVGGLAAAVIGIGAFWLTGPLWGAACALLALYEAYTLINSHPHDTISELVWEYSKRPIFVMLFCIIIGYAIGTGYLGESLVVMRAWWLGVLGGHFWFPRVCSCGKQ